MFFLGAFGIITGQFHIFLFFSLKYNNGYDAKVAHGGGSLEAQSGGQLLHY